MINGSSGSSQFGAAEKVLLWLGLLIACVYVFVPITAHGVLNWYVTGFDDLLIFSATYLVAKQKGKAGLAIFGVLVAVACMIALVALVGETFQGLGRYAKYSAVVPLSYAAWEIYKNWIRKASEDESKRTEWWMRYQIFGRAFFGFAANCLDDIALNTSMVTGAYANNATEYLTGIALGAVTMVVLAKVVGKHVKDYPSLQVGGYVLAAGVILFLSGSDA